MRCVTCLPGTTNMLHERSAAAMTAVLMGVLFGLFAIFTVAPASARGCEGHWLPVGLVPPGPDGSLGAMINWDPDGPGPLPTMLVVGGDFTTAGGAPANHIAML